MFSDETGGYCDTFRTSCTDCGHTPITQLSITLHIIPVSPVPTTLHTITFSNIPTTSPCNPPPPPPKGASPGVHMWLKTLIRNRNDCVLTPIPQYPLYSACLELYNGTLLPYYLDEERGWALSIPELKNQVETVCLGGLELVFGLYMWFMYMYMQHNHVAIQ